MTYPTSSGSGRHHTTDPGWGRYGTDRQEPPASQWSAHPDQDRGWWDAPAQRPADPPSWRQPATPASPQQQQRQSQPAWTPPPSPSEPRGWGMPDEPSDEEKFWADVRRQVAGRVRSINAKHCQEAFDRLGTRHALSPHGVVFFYTAPEAGLPHGYQLYFVTRLFLQGPESDDLARVIHDLTRSATMNIARAEATGRRWDPRGPADSMVNGGDLEMPRDASYLGVGVSTLNTQHGDWYTVASSVRNQPFNTPRPKTVFDLCGVGLATLVDGTDLRVDRDPQRPLGDDGVTCNRSLDAHRARYWNRAVDLTEQGDREIRGAWAQLVILHHTLQTYLDDRRSA